MAQGPNDNDLYNRTQSMGARPDAYDIPSVVARKRLSPALDPISRMRLTATAKWMLVAGIMLYVLGAPFHFRVAEPSDADLNAAKQSYSNDSAALEHAKKVAERSGDSDAAAMDKRVADLNKEQEALTKAQAAFDAQKSAAARSTLVNVIASAVIAAVLATGLPRLLVPAVFGRWREAIEAFRDWLIVGLATGGLYWITILVFRVVKAPPGNDFLANLIGLRDAGQTVFDPIWLKFRLPLVLLYALFGLLIARRMALRAEGIMGTSPGKVIGELLLQALLLGALARPIERVFYSLGAGTVGLGNFIVDVSYVLMLGAVGVVMWAYDADRHAMALHRRGHPALTGVDAGGERPVPMTLSIIGGRDSGKTVLMAAAYYEWLLKPFGQLRIKPVSNPQALNPNAAGYGTGRASGGTDLEQVAEELYGNNQFPVGTVSTQNLPFELSFGRETVCEFTMLDFPGGAVVGRAADQNIVQQFWDRLDNSDALMIIADMSYVRRGRKDPGFTQVFGAYVEAMRRLIDRNGKRRVVPIALVLTKCDEYYDPEIGNLNIAAINKGMEEFGYSGLETTWRQMCAQAGQPIVEFETWMTSAITFSQPQLDENGQEDLTRPYRIAPPPPPIAPEGCAAPVLWLTAKVMRWNVTAFRDLSSFLFGASPAQRVRIESVIEMERVADEHRQGAPQA